MAVMASELVHCRLRELLLVSGAHPRFINLKNVSNSIAYKPILMRMLRVPILALNIEKGFSVESLEIRKTRGALPEPRPKEALCVLVSSLVSPEGKKLKIVLLTKLRNKPAKIGKSRMTVFLSMFLQKI
jgi:hypothetical protein